MSIIWCMVWDMKHDRNNFLSFWDIFCTFTPLTTQKIKILKIYNVKYIKYMSLDIIIFHKCTKNHDYMLHCSWDMLCDRRNFNFSLWAIFCPFASNSPKNKLFLKKKKIPGDIIIYHKPWSYATLLLWYGAW